MPPSRRLTLCILTILLPAGLSACQSAAPVESPDREQRVDEPEARSRPTQKVPRTHRKVTIRPMIAAAGRAVFPNPPRQAAGWRS
ncbi:hypothetical protein RAS1_18000 [Phycisphaerae bacterium RAS1]|nr:hypothetical protein RAS1_18000 [Phycisphaerae bacterium RAS1]